MTRNTRTFFTFCRKKAILAFVIAVLCLAVAGCSGGGGSDKSSQPNDSSGDNYFQNQMSPTTNISATEPPSDVDFDMSAPAAPNFDNMTLTPAASEPLYTFEDGYAYLLDPDTLQKTGGPLDPVTKEPIEQEPAGEPGEEAGEGEPTDPAEPETPGETEEPPAAEIPEEVKLPNTGVFLEDD